MKKTVVWVVILGLLCFIGWRMVNDAGTRMSNYQLQHSLDSIRVVVDSMRTADSLASLQFDKDTATASVRTRRAVAAVEEAIAVLPPRVIPETTLTFADSAVYCFEITALTNWVNGIRDSVRVLNERWAEEVRIRQLRIQQLTSDNTKLRVLMARSDSIAQRAIDMNTNWTLGVTLGVDTALDPRLTLGVHRSLIRLPSWLP